MGISDSPRDGGKSNFLLEAYWQATGMSNVSMMKPPMDKWTRILSFSYGFLSPMDAQSGHATGRHKFHPCVIQKLLDKSSPLIAQALAQNTMVKDSQIKVFETKQDGSGKVEKYTINMKEARFIDVDVSSQDAGIVETIKMSFHSVELKDVPGATIADLNWSEGIH